MSYSMSLNESHVEDAAPEWFLLRRGFSGQGWTMRSGTWASGGNWALLMTWIGARMGRSRQG